MKNGKSVLKLLALIFILVGVILIGMGAAAQLVSGMGLFMFVMCLIGSIFLCIGGIFFFIDQVGMRRRQKLKDDGKFVYAQIVDIDVDLYKQVQIERISMNPFFILCRYRDGGGRTYDFKSGALLYNPSGLLQSDKLKVYVDLDKPKRYYVDTDEILPENAMLHKFKLDSEKNSQRLKNIGNYINATTCGVELFGRIKVNGIIKSQFLKLPDHIARQFHMSKDEKGRVFAGYTILCRYQDMNGIVHIFASKGILGEPDSPHMGEKVKVYYDGADYKYYHVDIDSLSH